MSDPQPFDVRDILNEGRRALTEEQSWLDSHQDAVASSELGGCLRIPWFRMNLQTIPSFVPSDQQVRRWYWGRMYNTIIHQASLAQNRRPRREQEVTLEVTGEHPLTIIGHADFVYTEAIVEAKTTAAWSLDERAIPFGNKMQLASYMAGLNRAGQLVYGNPLGNEWAFDFPTLPEEFEPLVRGIAEQFHYATDVAQIPPMRLYCATCRFNSICPREAAAEKRELSDLEAQIVQRYIAAVDLSRPAEKAADAAKAALLGVAEVHGEEGKATLEATGLPVRIEVGGYERKTKDTKELVEEVQAHYPDLAGLIRDKVTWVQRITVREV
jgi:hypothetical protein